MRCVVDTIPFKDWDETLWDKLRTGVLDQYRYAVHREITVAPDRSGWEFVIYLPVVLPIPGF